MIWLSAVGRSRGARPTLIDIQIHNLQPGAGFSGPRL
jgi:hypothetical protein